MGINFDRDTVPTDEEVIKAAGNMTLDFLLVGRNAYKAACKKYGEPKITGDLEWLLVDVLAAGYVMGVRAERKKRKKKRKGAKGA